MPVRSLDQNKGEINGFRLFSHSNFKRNLFWVIDEKNQIILMPEYHEIIYLWDWLFSVLKDKWSWGKKRWIVKAWGDDIVEFITDRSIEKCVFRWSVVILTIGWIDTIIIACEREGKQKAISCDQIRCWKDCDKTQHEHCLTEIENNFL